MSLLTRRNLTIGAIVIGIPALLLGWWLLSPLFLDSEVSEAFPRAAMAEIPDDMTAEEVEGAMVDAENEPDVAGDDDMPDSGPTALTSGEFTDADDFHMGSGTATIYEIEDGSLVLRLEDFEVTNGPDLHVLLVPHPDPASRDQVDGYVDLGSLKGNIGNQNYDIPGDIDVSEFGSVVIYCQPFHVLFSVASLSG